ncbi:MAG: hypothetical protein A3D92_15420 [Bacteroidetes bacterium RIFCSPHIGHO2_02_FULL_44_7]|nr:MAG: hypothetical protein A3D92_15420 [Bacteroidetes bacterium RIFCSPHIGHO2_02_FULL_44_7]
MDRTKIIECIEMNGIRYFESSSSASHFFVITDLIARRRSYSTGIAYLQHTKLKLKMIRISLLIPVLMLMASTVFSQFSLTEVAHYPYPGSRGDCSDIWGYVDGTGIEYAIVGNETGTSIVSLANPANPVEVFYSPGANTIWRDIKVWGTTAYITNEGDNGLKIIDLSNLPGPITAGDVSQFTGSTYPFTTAHNVFIDEQGRAYICGANNGVGGAIILDLTVDPLNPVEIGRYNEYYLHDVFVRGDTLWGGAINDGFFVVVDVSTPSSLVTWATQLTPNTFTHNLWLTDDGSTLYTTDEVSGAFLAGYDVSDINNISETDRIQSSPGNGVIPHNTFVLGDYLLTSYYRDGVTVHDVSNPNNMIELGSFDTSPSFAGDGFNGCWGVYPYLPSGLIIASDIEEGLYVIGANYSPAAYLEGTVTNSVTTAPINNASVQIVSTTQTDNTDALGEYATGVGSGGTFDVTFSKLGYVSQTITNVVLVNGNTTILDVQLVPLQTYTLSGQVIDQNSNPVQNAIVSINNSQYSTVATTNGLGNFDVPLFLEDTYDVTIGLWGYHTLCLTGQSLTIATNPHVYQLTTGYSDYFDLDLGWTVTGSVAAGDWERGEPVGTMYLNNESNPELDSDDCGQQAYITGNSGGAVGNDDVDDGTTTLSSPIFDLTSYSDPYISFDRWFFNDGGSTTPNDSLVVTLSNGTTTLKIDFATANDPNTSSWASKDIRVEDYMSKSALMQIKVRAMDVPGGHIVEGGFDNFVVRDSSGVGLDQLANSQQIHIYPVPFQNELTVSIDDAQAFQVIHIEVIDVASGRIVEAKDFDNSGQYLLTTDYAKGVYLVRVVADGELLTAQRVVKL